ncbi:MAG: GFA family protein [Phenylobacterium sp.]|uniref:GFA family protein n=1 Tax=Phenylobacterium sp. TaxID=1871053 RepID=UPI00391B8C12
MSLSGGCQCGAVRFRVERVGRASLCHCRMCQKAFGAFYGPYVDAHGLEWTRGAPKYFQSSNLVRRGFCGDCGTQLSFEGGDWPPNLAIGAFDNPAAIVPTLQIGLESKLPYVDSLADLPHRPQREAEKLADFYAAVVSRQHPDHDTEAWPPHP